MSSTDTNQASELFELCKEVYERTEWEDDLDHFDAGDTPIYNSDYLLEKLPNKIEGEHSIGWLTLSPMNKETWSAGYEADYIDDIDDYKLERSGTPLKALLKLTIALSEAGELENE